MDEPLAYRQRTEFKKVIPRLRIFEAPIGGKPEDHRAKTDVLEKEIGEVRNENVELKTVIEAMKSDMREVDKLLRQYVQIQKANNKATISSMAKCS